MTNIYISQFSIVGLCFEEMNDLLCRLLYSGIKATKDQFKNQVKEVYTNREETYTNREETYWYESDIRSTKQTIRFGEELTSKINEKFQELYRRDYEN